MGQLRRMLEHPLTQALAVYAAFMGPRREVWGAMTRVPASVYRGDCILVRALETQHVLVTMVGLLVLALACSRWRWADLWSSSSSSSSSSWEQAGTARAFRVSLSVIILAQVWLVVGAPYNLVADRAWGLDRGRWRWCLPARKTPRCRVSIGRSAGYFSTCSSPSPAFCWCAA